MNWFSSVIDQVWTLGTEIGSGIQWAWNSIPFTRTRTAIKTYSQNTSLQLIEQTKVLPKASFDLIYHRDSRMILNSMTRMVVYNILPVVSLNYLNNSVQNYMRQNFPEYSVLLAGLTLTDYAISAYTLRQGVQIFIHTTTVDMFGPTAFNATKEVPSATLCQENKCNGKRMLKGAFMEPLILLSNDLITATISRIPYFGKSSAIILGTFFVGRYITRSVTPERCEQHKAMMSESVLALGLSYELNSFLIDSLLKYTIGMPPFLHYRTLRHLLLLLHINLAAHMVIPSVRHEKSTVPIDPLELYEATCRFLTKVLFAGLIKRVPIDFKLGKGQKPLIPLSRILQLGTQLLNSDLEKTEGIKKPPVFISAYKNLPLWIYPPILQSTTGFINDPIISKFWPALREGAISSIGTVQSVGDTKAISTIAYAPKSVAAALYYIVGIPKSVTKIVLMLSQEQDVWDLLMALKLWFERHNLKYEVALTNRFDPTYLHGIKFIELPEEEHSNTTYSANNLLSERPEEGKVIKPSDLITIKQVNVSVEANSLFSTRKKQHIKNETDEKKKIIIDPNYFNNN